jgi:hypothetical protein
MNGTGVTVSMLMLRRRLITRNWVLKLFSLLLAILMWSAIRGGNNDQRNLAVPLVFRNIPPEMEITGMPADQVTLQLRGSFDLLAGLSSANITATISLTGEVPGHKVIRIREDNVDIPRGAVGVEVFHVDPDFVEFDLEHTLSKPVDVQPSVFGEPAEGYMVVGGISVTPASVNVEGPASSIAELESLSTLPVRIDGRTESLRASVNLDVPNTRVVRLRSLAPVEVLVEIAEIPAEDTYRIPLDPALAPKWNADVDRVDVRVSGPASQVEAFDPQGLYFTFEPALLPEDGSVIPTIHGLPETFAYEVSPASVVVSEVD